MRKTNLLRRLGGIAGSVALWALMLVGAGSLALWGLNSAGLVQPLIVVSGSMSPEIETGDLLFAIATPPGDLAVGDVATLQSAETGNLVTHRVIEITETDGAWHIRMQGDANAVADNEVYVVGDGDRVWQPRLTIAGGGYFVSSIMRPVVAVPLVFGILSLCALALFPSRSREREVPQKDAAAQPRPTSPRHLTRREWRRFAS